MNPSSKSKGGKAKKKVRSWKLWAVVGSQSYSRPMLCEDRESADLVQNDCGDGYKIIRVTITENRPSGRRKGR